MTGLFSCLRIAALALWTLFFPALAPCFGQEAAAPGGDRLELSVTSRSLGYRDLREPTSFTPSAAFVPQYSGWTRNWSETRLYASLAYRLVDTERCVIIPGWNMGTSFGRFEAKNVGIGYYEAWETQPALLWGPSIRVLVRQAPLKGGFLLLRYELFLASAPEGREEVASRSGTSTPTSQRDASFSWTSHEVTAALGYDWGRVAVAGGLSLSAFRLDKRLTHHIDPAGATGSPLAAILALNSQPSRYGYEPQSLFAPYLAVTFRPVRHWSLEGSLRPAAQPDATLSLSFSF